MYLSLGTDADARQQAYRALFRSQLDADALTQIRKPASRELVLGNERFRREIERALGRRVAPRERGRRRKREGIEGEQMGLEFDSE